MYMDIIIVKVSVGVVHGIIIVKVSVSVHGITMSRFL